MKQGEVEVLINGVSYAGKWTVSEGSLHLSNPQGERTAKLGAATPAVLAQSMLRGLILELLPDDDANR